MCDRRHHAGRSVKTADGTVISSLHRRQYITEFKKTRIKIDAQVLDHLLVQLVCDNYGTHKSPATRKWSQRPRLHMHPTPDLLRLAQPSRTLDRLSHRRPAAPRRPPQRVGIEERPPCLGQAWNEAPIPLTWTKTADQILTGDSEKLMTRISGAVHLGMYQWQQTPAATRGRTVVPT